MGAEKRLLPIKEAFQLAQKPHQNQAKLMVALSRTYLAVGTPDPGPGPPLPLALPQGPPLTLLTAHRDSILLKTLPIWFGEDWLLALGLAGTPSS